MRFLENLTRFGVSKLSLLLITIEWLLGMLSLAGALFLESPWFVGFPAVAVHFSCKLICFMFCPRKEEEKTLKK